MDDLTHNRAFKMARIDSRSLSSFFSILVDREWERLIAQGKLPADKAA